jgi:citrate lyase alpha subunit
VVADAGIAVNLRRNHLVLRLMDVRLGVRTIAASRAAAGERVALGATAQTRSAAHHCRL